jgi:sec-independent protein translocase protein TatA
MGLSLGEIIVILLVGFVVLGPDKMPEVGRGLGKAIASFKRAVNDSGLLEEVEDIKQSAGVSDLKNDISDAERQFKKDLKTVTEELDGKKDTHHEQS